MSVMTISCVAGTYHDDSSTRIAQSSQKEVDIPSSLPETMDTTEQPLPQVMTLDSLLEELNHSDDVPTNIVRDLSDATSVQDVPIPSQQQPHNQKIEFPASHQEAAPAPTEIPVIDLEALEKRVDRLNAAPADA
ncbi:MAG: hypothetical protein VSS75_006170, partial [Candidatus Parabeggiatoa sp.]|nr:hypothetical protein [Candidatus Parabeggiatoa sp.]